MREDEVIEAAEKIFKEGRYLCHDKGNEHLFVLAFQEGVYWYIQKLQKIVNRSEEK